MNFFYLNEYYFNNFFADSNEEKYIIYILHNCKILFYKIRIYLYYTI